MTSAPSKTPLPAKRPKTALAGPYGHPFHPILVTVPIGAWVASLIFDIIAKVGDNPAAFADGAFWLLIIGIVGALVAAPFGTMDLLTIPAKSKAAGTALAHLALNTAALVVFAIDALVRREQGRDDVSTLALGLTILGLLVVSASGWLGGKLSYSFGVRVAEERDQVPNLSVPGASPTFHAADGGDQTGGRA
jgi:uncharacterized membrane protein